MVYSDNKGRKTLVIILLLVILGAVSYYFAGDQIKEFINKNLLSQVTFRYEGDSTEGDNRFGERTEDTSLTTSAVSTGSAPPHPYLDFINQLTTIVDEHKASPNSTKTVKRAQTTKALLESFANQLSLPSSKSGEYYFGQEWGTDAFINDDGTVKEDFFIKISNQGHNIISFDPFDLEGETIIESPSLTAAGFTVEPANSFEDVLIMAKKYNIDVYIMIEAIGHIVFNMKPYDPRIKPEIMTLEWTKNLMKEFDDLGDKHGVKIGFTEEALDESYFEAVVAKSKELQTTHVHFFEDFKCRPDLLLSEDYAYYPRDVKNNAEDLEYLKTPLFDTGAYYGKLGFLNIMYGVAKGCNIKAGVATAGGWGFGPRTHQNIALMRAVEHGSTFYMFILAEDDNGTIFPDEETYLENYNFNTELLPLINEFGRKETDVKKPTANLIIQYHPETVGGDAADIHKTTTLASADTITGALLAAGYEIVATENPIGSADLYYVLVPSSLWGEGVDLPTDLLQLAEGDKPVFYQPIGEIPTTGNWGVFAQRLGINAQVILDETDPMTFEPIPEVAEFTFPEGPNTVRYAGYSFEADTRDQLGSFTYGHMINNISPDTPGIEVLMKGMTAADGDEVFDDEVALVFKKNNVYFVNGSFIHFETSNALANIMAKARKDLEATGGQSEVFNKPSYVYFTNGETRSVLFAPYGEEVVDIVEVDINVLGGTTVTEFDDKGTRLETSSLELNNGRLTGTVTRFHLYVIN